MPVLLDPMASEGVDTLMDPSVIGESASIVGQPKKPPLVPIGWTPPTSWKLVSVGGAQGNLGNGMPGWMGAPPQQMKQQQQAQKLGDGNIGQMLSPEECARLGVPYGSLDCSQQSIGMQKGAAMSQQNTGMQQGPAMYQVHMSAPPMDAANMYQVQVSAPPMAMAPSDMYQAQMSAAPMAMAPTSHTRSRDDDGSYGYGGSYVGADMAMASKGMAPTRLVHMSPPPQVQMTYTRQLEDLPMQRVRLKTGDTYVTLADQGVFFRDNENLTVPASAAPIIPTMRTPAAATIIARPELSVQRSVQRSALPLYSDYVDERFLKPGDTYLSLADQGIFSKSLISTQSVAPMIRTGLAPEFSASDQILWEVDYSANDHPSAPALQYYKDRSIRLAGTDNYYSAPQDRAYSGGSNVRPSFEMELDSLLRKYNYSN